MLQSYLQKKKRFFKTKINKILFKVSIPVTVTYKILLIKNYTWIVFF